MNDCRNGLNAEALHEANRCCAIVTLLSKLVLMLILGVVYLIISYLG